MPAEFEDKIVYWCFADGWRLWDPIMHLSRELIQTGDIVVDVGANVGIWLMAAARRIGQTGHLYAFEPLASNVARLQRNLALNQITGVQVESLALSDHSGQTRFYAPSNGNSGMGSLGAHAGVIQICDVEATTLDSYCAAHAIEHVDLMKIDVEGAEERVLAGGASLFQGVGAPPVMFEANDDLAANLNSSTCAAKQMLSDFGYQIYRVLPNRLNPVEIHERHWGEDLIALKPEHFLRHSELFQAFSR